MSVINSSGGGGASYNGDPTTIVQDSTHRFATDAEKTSWDSKASASHGHAISDTTGLQTALDGKQSTLVSATNIKTINGSSVLGSGDLIVSGSGLAQYQVRQLTRR